MHSYHLWEAGGHRDGRGAFYWDQAIAQLQNESGVAASPMLPDVLDGVSKAKRGSQGKKGASKSKEKTDARPDHELEVEVGYSIPEPRRTTKSASTAAGTNLEKGKKSGEPPA